MHSTHLIHFQPVDRFNVRTSLLVVGIFGIISIISYFYELSKAGLLTRGDHNLRYSHYKREVGGLPLFAGSSPYNGIDSQAENLDQKIEKIKQAVVSNVSDHGKPPIQRDIKLALHLGKNSSYESHDNTTFRVYNYKNTLPNFFLLNFNISETFKVETSRLNASNIKSLKRSRIPYMKSTMVLLHQHDPTGYIVRDCYKYQANNHGLFTSNLSINSRHRQHWDTIGLHKREKFQALHGSLSFGVCEGMRHPCSYLTMVPHPLDRILEVYHFCQKNHSELLCHMSHTNKSIHDLKGFIRAQANSLFQKLLYHSRQCRLIEEDEVCLEDSEVTFLMSPSDRAAHLENILKHLDDWFSVVGLVERLNESLALVDFLHGLDIGSCVLQHRKSNQNPSVLGDTHNTVIDGVPYAKLRQNLLNDSYVQKTLSADLAIYEKLVEIFNKQLLQYQAWHNTPHELAVTYNVTFPMTKEQLSLNVPNITENRTITHSETSRSNYASLDANILDNTAPVMLLSGHAGKTKYHKKKHSLKRKKRTSTIQHHRHTPAQNNREN